MCSEGYVCAFPFLEKRCKKLSIHSRPWCFSLCTWLVHPKHGKNKRNNVWFPLRKSIPREIAGFHLFSNWFRHFLPERMECIFSDRSCFTLDNNRGALFVLNSFLTFFYGNFNVVCVVYKSLEFFNNKWYSIDVVPLSPPSITFSFQTDDMTLKTFFSVMLQWCIRRSRSSQKVVTYKDL